MVTCLVRSADWAADRARLELHGAVAPDDLPVWRHLSDCVLVAQIVASTLERDPDLSNLIRQTRARLAGLERELPQSAAQALTADQALFERSLRRDLRLDRRSEMASEDDRLLLTTRLTARLDWLERLETRPDSFAGVWRNATGEVLITRADHGQFRVEAARADIEFLGWTCEFSGNSRGAGAGRLQDIQDASLRFSLADGMLHVEQDAAPDYCGGGASLSGRYFATRSGPAA